MGTDIRGVTSYYKNTFSIDGTTSDNTSIPREIAVMDPNDPRVLRDNPYLNAVLGDATRKSVEALLPKYNITEGDSSADVSQARMYFTEPASKSRLDVLRQFSDEIDFDSGSAYVGFLLTSASENRSEKVQTMPLHGDNYVATFYGESPRTYTFSGIFYNTRNASWRDIFTKLYDYLFRGSAAAKNRTLTQIVYDNRIVSGWILNLSQNIAASNEMMVNFNFSMLVRKEVILTPANALSYNNAYFTGSTAGFDRTEGIDALPDFDDYLNTARIKPPPRPRRASGVRRPNCRVNRAALQQRGSSTAARLNPRQGTAQASPRGSKCDLSQSIIQTRRALQDKIRQIKSSGANAAEVQRRLELLHNSVEARDLRAAYSQTDFSGLSENERTRRTELLGIDGFRTAAEVTNFDSIENMDAASVANQLTELEAVVAENIPERTEAAGSSPTPEAPAAPEPAEGE